MKDDVISRQAAIDELKAMYHAAEKWGEEASDDTIKIRAESCMASLVEMKLRIEKLPSAEPERAIKDCRNCKHGNYNDHWGTCFCYHSGDCNDWDKWEPSAQPDLCEYCNEDADGFVTPLEKNGHAFVRFGMNGWELSLRANGWHGSAKIRYCPMCGRDLFVK